jgi:peptidoglycan L-alanyl-D-glutamate endopeptidase CwlK
MYSFGSKSKLALAGVHPNLVKVLTAAIVDSPIDFTINEGVRSLATQQKYYASGRTKKGPIITNADGVRNKSNHQVKADGYGHAVDLYPFVNGQVKYDDEKDLKIIAAHIKETGSKLGIPITWGGDWRTIIDFPHFELKS